jgi:hypothetical protein
MFMQEDQMSFEVGLRGLSLITKLINFYECSYTYKLWIEFYYDLYESGSTQINHLLIVDHAARTSVFRLIPM